MAKSIKVEHKKRGRPATGKDSLYGLRISDDLMGRIQKWASKQEVDLNRSQAIRQLLEIGLKANVK
jgi:hypothetical protein